MNQVQVAKYTVSNERNRKHHRIVSWNVCFRDTSTERIQRVRDERRSSYDVNEIVEQGHGIFAENRALRSGIID